VRYYKNSTVASPTIPRLQEIWLVLQGKTVESETKAKLIIDIVKSSPWLTKSYQICHI
jgi:hypothetical protein